MERENSSTWVKSYMSMFSYFREHHMTWYYHLLPWLSNTHDKLERLNVHNLILSSASDCGHYNTLVCQAMWEDQYNRHNAAVKAMVPPSHLLEYRVGEGWDRLCTFLEKDVPDTEFPHENKGGVAGNIADQVIQFDLYQRGDREVRISVGKMVMASAVLVGGLWCFYSGRVRFTR